MICTSVTDGDFTCCRPAGICSFELCECLAGCVCVWECVWVCGELLLGLTSYLPSTCLPPPTSLPPHLPLNPGMDTSFCLVRRVLAAIDRCAAHSVHQATCVRSHTLSVTHYTFASAQCCHAIVRRVHGTRGQPVVWVCWLRLGLATCRDKLIGVLRSEAGRCDRAVLTLSCVKG
jgi:hypothetical protein